MYTRVSPWTVFGSVLVIGGALLACKDKKKEVAPTTTPETPTSASPAATTAPEMPTKTFNVGDTAKAFDYSLAVETVKQCTPKYYFSKPKKDSMWLGVELVVGAISDKQVWSNPSYAKLIDDDGLTYNYTFATTKDCDPALNATQLNKSEKAKGWVIFEVPQKAKGLKLTYNPSPFGTPQQVKFDLGKLPGEQAATTETTAPTQTAAAAPPKTTTTAPPKATTAPTKTPPAKTSTPTTGPATALPGKPPAPKPGDTK